jgi:hypothetical protein
MLRNFLFLQDSKQATQFHRIERLEQIALPQTEQPLRCLHFTLPPLETIHLSTRNTCGKKIEKIYLDH